MSWIARVDAVDLRKSLSGVDVNLADHIDMPRGSRALSKADIRVTRCAPGCLWVRLSTG